MVGISTGFVCCGQYWLVNPTVLSVVNNIGCYIPWFVCHEQNWLVYQPVLSVVDKNSWYINRFCRSWTILGGIFHGCVLLRQYWLVNQPVFFLSWTVMIGLSPCFVCQTKPGYITTSIVHNRLIRLIYQPILSTTKKTRRYTNHYCP